MTLQQILEEVKNGQLSVEHAENLLKKEGYEEMDYAKLDTTRKERTRNFMRKTEKCLEQGRPGISMNW